MQYANTGQIRAIHAALSRLGLRDDKEYKRERVLEYSDGRTESTKGLYYREAKQLVNDLNKIQGARPEAIRADGKRKAIIAIAYKMRWELENGKADMERIDAWCRKYGYLHKGLNEYTNNELAYLLVQFKNVYKSYLNRF